MRNKSRLASLFVALFVALSALAFTGTSAQATKPNPEHKVWVCHATSGLGELKNGYNLIHVDVASTRGQAHLAHATTNPKNNSRFGLLYDYIDVDPNNLPGKCGETPTPPKQPDDIVEVTPWVDGTFECEDTTVEQTRIVTTTVYVLVDGVWVKGQPTSEEETQTRELSQDEVFACPTKPDEVTFGDWIGEPECGETSFIQTRDVTTVSFVWNGDGFTETTVVTQETREVQVEEVESCPTTPTTPPTVPPTVPPTTEPPATTQPPVVVTTEPPTVSIGTAPVPPTQPPFTPTATPGDELPETGTNNGLLLLIAAGMFGAGSLLIAATRRKGTIN